jgi:hypothetical protein
MRGLFAAAAVVGLVSGLAFVVLRECTGSSDPTEAVADPGTPTGEAEAIAAD